AVKADHRNAYSLIGTDLGASLWLLVWFLRMSHASQRNSGDGCQRGIVNEFAAGPRRHDQLLLGGKMLGGVPSLALFRDPRSTVRKVNPLARIMKYALIPRINHSSSLLSLANESRHANVQMSNECQLGTNHASHGRFI